MAACERCPAPGACGACPLRSSLIIRGESGSGEVLVVEDYRELFSKKPQGLRKGTFIFSSVGQGSGEPPTRASKETCSICKEPASTCLHSEASKR